MNFLSGIMAQADFVMSNFEKTWTAAYLISLIKIMEKPWRGLEKKLFSVKNTLKWEHFLEKTNNGGKNVNIKQYRMQ